VSNPIVSTPVESLEALLEGLNGACNAAGAAGVPPLFVVGILEQVKLDVQLRIIDQNKPRIVLPGMQ
jgi:hypothetical protein